MSKRLQTTLNVYMQYRFRGLLAGNRSEIDPKKKNEKPFRMAYEDRRRIGCEFWSSWWDSRRDGRVALKRSQEDVVLFANVFLFFGGDVWMVWKRFLRFGEFRQECLWMDVRGMIEFVANCLVMSTLIFRKTLLRYPSKTPSSPELVNLLYHRKELQERVWKQLLC